jgi:hypothetical protein
MQHKQSGEASDVCIVLESLIVAPLAPQWNDGLLQAKWQMEAVDCLLQANRGDCASPSWLLQSMSHRSHKSTMMSSMLQAMCARARSLLCTKRSVVPTTFNRLHDG